MARLLIQAGRLVRLAGRLVTTACRRCCTTTPPPLPSPVWIGTACDPALRGEVFGVDAVVDPQGQPVWPWASRPCAVLDVYRGTVSPPVRYGCVEFRTDRYLSRADALAAGVRMLTGFSPSPYFADVTRSTPTCCDCEPGCFRRSYPVPTVAAPRPPLVCCCPSTTAPNGVAVTYQGYRHEEYVPDSPPPGPYPIDSTWVAASVVVVGGEATGSASRVSRYGNVPVQGQTSTVTEVVTPPQFGLGPDCPVLNVWFWPIIIAPPPGATFIEANEDYGCSASYVRLVWELREAGQLTRGITVAAFTVTGLQASAACSHACDSAGAPPGTIPPVPTQPPPLPGGGGPGGGTPPAPPPDPGTGPGQPLTPAPGVPPGDPAANL